MNRPTTPKPIKPPITPAISSSSGKSTPRLIRSGFITLSITAMITVHTASAIPHATLPDQNSQHDRRDEHRQRSELRDAEHERDREQHARARHAADPEREPGEQRLNERGHDDAERDAAGGARGEAHGLLRSVAADAARERNHAVRRELSLRVQDRGQDHRQQEMHGDDADAACHGHRPARGRARVRTQHLGDTLGAVRGEVALLRVSAPAPSHGIETSQWGSGGKP